MQDRECHFCDWEGPKNRYPAHLGEGECPGPETEETQLVADGGRRLPDPGDVVRDRDATDDPPTYLLVLETHPDTPARCWEIDSEDATVAELNPGYDPEAPVVRAVYVESLGRYLSGPYDVEKAVALADAGDIYIYDFPAPRLEWDADDADAVAGGETA